MNASTARESGYSLIEVMIAVAIGTTFVLGLMTVMDSQNKAARSVAQKLEVVSLKQSMLALTNNPQVCACQLDRNINLAQAVHLGLDTTNPSSVPDITLDHVQSDCAMTSPGPYLVQAGQPILGTQTGVKVTTVKVVNIHAQTGSADSYTGTLQASIDPASTGISLHPVEVPITMNVDLISASTPASVTGNARISACSGFGAGASQTPAIVCSLSSRPVFTDPVSHTLGAGVTAYGPQTVYFNASECTYGALPDASYVGMFAKTSACGPTDSWSVVQPAEHFPPGFTVNVGPFIDYPNCPSGLQNPRVEIVFVKRGF